MTMLGFDSAGRCVFAVNDEIQGEQLSQYAAVVRIDGYVDPNTVWYDVENGRMGFRRAFTPTVMTNAISGLPPGTTALVREDLVQVDDGTLELEVDYPEVIPVTLMNVRFLDTTVEVPCEVAG